jgi:hypothetical protein
MVRNPTPRLNPAVAFAIGIALPAVLRIGRHAIVSGRVRTRVHRSLHSGCCYGSLAAVVDSEQRSLRSIGVTAREAAARTGGLLDGLRAMPGVRIFHGVRTPGANLPVIPHVIISGPRLVLIESVAWPSGRYEIMADGRICCDGTYTGQSVRPFLSALTQWRKIAPVGHHVSAIIIVHTRADEDVSLPGEVADDLAWVRAGEVISDIGRRLPSSHERVSTYLLAVLISATADDR